MMGLKVLWIVLQAVIAVNLIMPLFILLISKIRSKKRKVVQATNMITESDIAVVVTAFEQTDLLPDVVRSILASDYSNYLVYIVADKCDVSRLHFDDSRVIVLRPETVLASNTASHFYAIERFRRAHDYLTIIDSDNLIHQDYLFEINKTLASGYSAVQGVREAKNLDSFYAGLDAARDIYYHYYDGLKLYQAGSSATLAGSGMAFSVRLYKKCLSHLAINGAGFDKILQYMIVKEGVRIAYCDTAIVYDQKTSNKQQLVNQRARWINTWFRYFFFGFDLIKKGIWRRNWNQFLFGSILLRPPLFIFLLLSVLFMMINILLWPVLAFTRLGLLLVFVVSFFVPVAKSTTDSRVYESLKYIPVFIYYQVVSLLRIKNANRYSVATRHTIQPKSTDQQ